MFYVYRFVAGSDDQTTEIGYAETRIAARDMAMREGGDQIQEGRDGEVENVDRRLWSPGVRRSVEHEESNIFPKHHAQIGDHIVAGKFGSLDRDHGTIIDIHGDTARVAWAGSHVQTDCPLSDCEPYDSADWERHCREISSSGGD